jgi:signal transduction histidine kinase
MRPRIAMEGYVLSARDKLWTVLLLALVAAQLLISVFMHRGTGLTIASDLLYGTVLLLATVAFVPNIFHSTSRSRARLFWILMSTGMFFWLVYQGIWNYFEVFLRKEVPVVFAGDVVLFLHLVPMIAALALLPHHKDSERNTRVGMLDFALLLIWWVFLYVYTVIPWQYVEPSESLYTSNYNQVYLTEKLVLLLALIYAVYNSRGGWKQFYGQLLAAIALYASSSYVANWAIGRSLYYSGSIYDIPLTLSIAWMAVLGKFGQRFSLTESERRAQPLLAVWITRFAMLAVFSLPWLAIVAQRQNGCSQAVKTFRVDLSLITLVVMGGLVFWRQYLLGFELSHLLRSSRGSYQDLQALQQQLIQAEKLASLGRLMGGAAHEINNPLAAMLGYSDILSSSELHSEERRLAARISEQVRRTRSLVANLLSFASQPPLRRAAVDVNSIVQTALRILHSQLESQSIATQVVLSGPFPPVSSDSNQLLHVILHLAGQVCSQATSENATVLSVRTRTDGDWVVLEFIGDGDENRPWLPLDEEAAEKRTTLSLSACHRIVKEHGGRILCHSLSEGPTAFRIELPPAATNSAQSSSSGEIAGFRAVATSGS